MKFDYLKVGDHVWVTTTRWRSSEKEAIEEMVVTKVARKYVSVNTISEHKYYRDYQFEIATGIEKGEGNYLRNLVVSPEVWEEEKRRARIVEDFRSHFRGYSNPIQSVITTEDIINAAKLLKLELKS